MKNIAILTDSSISLTKEQIKDTKAIIAPLTIIHNGKEYLDEVTITNTEVNDLLRDNAVLTTSQPSMGDILQQIEKEDLAQYDHVFVLPLSQYLSGTQRSYEQAFAQTDLTNFTIIHTDTLVGPIQYGIDTIIKLNNEGKSVEEIVAKLNTIFDNTESYVIPKTLKQLKASGRISSSAATMASLLKIKPILKLATHGANIDKFATARTDAKAYSIVIEDMKKAGVNPQTHKMFLLHSEGEAYVNAFLDQLTQELGTFEYSISVLPAVLAAHAGLGTITIQYTIK